MPLRPRSPSSTDHDASCAGRGSPPEPLRRASAANGSQAAGAVDTVPNCLGHGRDATVRGVLSDVAEWPVGAGRREAMADAEILLFPGPDHRRGGPDPGLAYGPPVSRTGWGAANAEDELVADFLAGCSAATASGYRHDLAEIAGYLRSAGTGLLAARRADLAGYVADARARGLRPATIRRRLGALGSFYRHCCERGVLERSPLARFRRPPAEHRVRLGLEPYEVERLWAAARAEGGYTPLLVGLLLVAGLRVSEAVGLDGSDLSVRDGVVVAEVTRKGGRREAVRLAEPVGALALRARARAAGGSGPLLRGARGGRLGRQQAWRVVARLGEAAGLDSPLTPHVLRHTHVTRALAAGVGLVGVQASAGHRDVRTTLAYAQALLRVRGVAGEAVAGLIGQTRTQ